MCLAFPWLNPYVMLSCGVGYDGARVSNGNVFWRQAPHRQWSQHDGRPSLTFHGLYRRARNRIINIFRAQMPEAVHFYGQSSFFVAFREEKYQITAFSKFNQLHGTNCCILNRRTRPINIHQGTAHFLFSENQSIIAAKRFSRDFPSSEPLRRRWTVYRFIFSTLGSHHSRLKHKRNSQWNSS